MGMQATTSVAVMEYIRLSNATSPRNLIAYRLPITGHMLWEHMLAE